jgi:hypothetical protein
MKYARNPSYAILIAMAIFVALPAASAQKISVWGTGQMSCGRWLAERNSEGNRSILHNWVLGFISGNNWYTKRQANPPDADGVSSFVDQYCQNNPLHPIFLAAAALVGEVGGPRATHDWKR